MINSYGFPLDDRLSFPRNDCFFSVKRMFREVFFETLLISYLLRPLFGYICKLKLIYFGVRGMVVTRGDHSPLTKLINVNILIDIFPITIAIAALLLNSIDHLSS